LPQLLHDQASDIVRRYAVRAEELGLARLWSLDSVPGSATAPSSSARRAARPHDRRRGDGAIGLGVAVVVLAAQQPAVARDDRSAELYAHELP
jgi:hypothetical protein